MTGEIITTELFQEIPVRIIQHEKDNLIPLVDIAHGITHDPYELIRLYERNSDLLKDYAQTVIMSTGNQVAPVGHVCLNRDGVLGLLMKLNYNRIKSPEKKAQIIKFQKWAIETLGKVMDGKPVTAPVNVPALVEDHLKIAKLMSDNIGISLHIASTVALSAVEDQTGANLSWCKGLLRAGDHPTEYLNPTEIGKDLGITAIRVNSILQELGYQIKQGKEWTLTTSGKLYGEVFPFDIRHKNGSLHTGYQIRWLPDIVQFIRGRLAHDIQVSIAGAGR